MLYIRGTAYVLYGGAFIGKYFGTDGFRGEAGVTVTAARAYAVGRILGHVYGRGGHKCRAVIGKDTRLSSYMLEYALAAGLTASGADAYILHVTTTASVSYVTRCDGFDCGVMISASHNPYGDNGIKLFNDRGEKTEESVLEEIESYLDTDLAAIPAARGDKIGRTVDYVAGRNRYIGHLISLAACSYKGLRVGLDAANGSAWQIARSVFDALGAKTFCIGCEPNGVNVNDGVGSTHTGKIAKLVKDNSLDIAFAFDGDADRCICVDGDGNVIDGDGELYICASYLKRRGELADDRIVCTVLSNGGLIKSLAAKGISCSVCGVGDKNVCDEMAKCGAALGGEGSGHIVFSKYETTGDGLVTAVMITEAVTEAKRGVASLLKDYSPLPQKLISFKAADREKVAARLQLTAREIEKARGLRIVVRPSGTENAVRVMAEGVSLKECAAACARLRAEACGQ